MGKSAKKPRLHQKDVFHRLNFLYQAAHTSLTGCSADWNLSRHYTVTMRALAKKNVLRLHPNVKRTLCKVCDMLLIPGISSKIRLVEGKNQLITVECLNCNFQKRFPCKEDYVLWHDKPENIDQVIVLEKLDIQKCTAKGKASNEKIETTTSIARQKVKQSDV